VDYVNPQLILGDGSPKSPYKKLLPWWAEVSRDVHFICRIVFIPIHRKKIQGDPATLGNQLRLNRVTDNVHGVVHFSSRAITNNSGGLLDTLKNDFYKYPALVPLMSWKDQGSAEPGIVRGFQSRQQLDNHVVAKTGAGS
jgi:hypothetical protein